MPSAGSRKRQPRREERVSRTYRLPLSKLRAAKRALDLAVFQRELIDGTRAMLGIEITPPDAER